MNINMPFNIKSTDQPKPKSDRTGYSSVKFKLVQDLD